MNTSIKSTNSDIISIKARWMLDSRGNTLKNRHIIVENKKISYVGDYKSSEIPRDANKIDYKHGLVLPPFINSHTHIPETLIRGIRDDSDLYDWLFNHVWIVEPQMKASDARIGTQLGIAEMLASGTIGFVDQFYYSNEIAKVVYETGVKAFLAPSIFDGNAETKTIENAYNENIRVIKNWHMKDNRIFVGFGPHATYTVPEELFLKIYEQAEKYDTFIHTHMQETKREVREAIEKYGLSPIERMNKLGILERIFAAHCVHLSDKDFALIKEKKVNVLHNIQSNLKLGSGIAEIPKMLDMGINVSLGTDGNASNNNLDMLEEVRLTALIHKGIHYNPQLISYKTALKMATQNAAPLLFNSYTGKIETNQPADLIIVDLKNVNSIPVINPVSNWVFSSSSSNVVLTMADGKILYQDGNYSTLNIDHVLEDASKSTQRMMKDANYTATE